MRSTAFPLTVLVVVAGCASLVGDDELTPGTDLPPAIAITSPVNGTTVSSIVTVTSSVSSTIGATSVRFDLPGGASITDMAPPFSVDWDSTAVPDGSYTINATATDTLGAAATTSATMIVANEACVGTFIADDLPRRIPDDNPGGITSSLAITDRARVASLSLSLRITHRFPPDLHIALISPSGAQYPVATPTIGSSAPRVIVDDQQISAFDGQSADGLWTLAVQDVVPDDVGTLDAWSLSIASRCSAASQ